MALEPRGFLRRQRQRARDAQGGSLNADQRGIMSNARDRSQQIQNNERLTNDERRDRMQTLRTRTRGLMSETLNDGGPSVAPTPEPVERTTELPETSGPFSENPVQAGTARGTMAPREDYGSTSVSELVSDITDQDSQIMQQAATEGRQIANRRGLLNSTLAAQASQSAVLDRAIPMAQQEAAQNFQRGLSRQEFEQSRELQERGIAGEGRLSRQAFEQSSSLSDQEFQQQFGLTRLEYEQRLIEQERGFGFESQLSRQNFEQASDLSDQEFEQSMGLTREEYQWRLRLQETDQAWRSGEAALDRDLQTQLQSGQIEFQEWQTRFDGRLRERLANMEISENQRNAFSTAMSNATAAYQTEFQSIMNNTNLTAEQRESFLNEAANRFNAQVGMYEDLYDLEVDWPEPEGDGGSGGGNGGGSGGGNGGGNGGGGSGGSGGGNGGGRGGRGGGRRNPPPGRGSPGQIDGNWTWRGSEEQGQWVYTG